MKINKRIIRQDSKIFKRQHQRLLFVFLILMVPFATYSQTSIFEEIKEQMNSYSTNGLIVNGLAMLSAMDNSVGFVGLFPHFSVGINGGATFTGVDKTNNLLQGETTDFLGGGGGFGLLESIMGMGGMIPLYFRIGGPDAWKKKFPFEGGLYVGGFIVNPIIDALLKEFDENIGWEGINIGFSLRVLMIEEEKKIPNLTLGLSYGYKYSFFSMPLTEDFDFDITPDDSDEVNISVDNAVLSETTHSHILSLGLHTSKLLLFFEPMLKISPFVGYINSDLKLSAPNTQVSVENDIYSLSEYFSAFTNLFTETIYTDSDGFGYKQDNWVGGVNISAGFGFKMNIFYTDFILGYEPFSTSISAKLGSSFVY